MKSGEAVPTAHCPPPTSLAPSFFFPFIFCHNTSIHELAIMPSHEHSHIPTEVYNRFLLRAPYPLNPTLTLIKNISVLWPFLSKRTSSWFFLRHALRFSAF